MSRFKMFVCLPCVLVMVLAALLVTGISAVPTAHAQASQRAIPATDTSNCVSRKFSSHQIFCDGPSITTFCSGQQFFPATDGFGKAIDWTFSDVNNTCVKVSYTLQSSFSECDIEMYIPNGDATATFTYTWFDGTTHTGTFNENPVDGWQFLFSSTNASSLSFTDHDSPGGLQLGWGSNASDSVRITCS
jgi:hypothetical protein